MSPLEAFVFPEKAFPKSEMKSYTLYALIKLTKASEQNKKQSKKTVSFRPIILSSLLKLL
jgi:hypothetical protein